MRLLVAETENLEAVARTQHDGDRDDALLRRRQEIALSKRALLREHRLRDGRVVEAVEIVEPPAELDVGHGLDVECEHVHGFSGGGPAPGTARISTATATMRPASSLSVRWPSPTPSFLHKARPRSE